MKTVSWDSIKDLIGEDLAMFSIFMSTVQSNKILLGMHQVVKGEQYFSEDTLESMYKDLTFGLCRQMLENHIAPDVLDIHDADDSVFIRAVEDLSGWLSMQTENETSSYFKYLEQWNSESKNWTDEHPLTFIDFVSSQNSHCQAA